jgi:protocatechuate 3,4-dioxygenase alpha subunit
MITASQTVGPFFAFSLTAKPLGQMRQPHTAGEPVRLVIRLLDGEGAPIPDGMIELWQADASGKYAHPEDRQSRAADATFCGFGRMGTDQTGTCVFETIRPGRVPGRRETRQAPHINVIVLGRGMLLPLFTRIYFAGDLANKEDAAMSMVPEDRRPSLFAQPDANRPGTWNFDIHLCGDRETVFFDL